MNNINFDDKSLTTLAFVIGLALIDNLSSTEQNAVGNWIMLIAQTLCTNGSYTFNKEWKRLVKVTKEAMYEGMKAIKPWKSHIGDDNGITKDTLRKTSDIINREINKL